MRTEEHWRPWSGTEQSTINIGSAAPRCRATIAHLCAFVWKCIFVLFWVFWFMSCAWLCYLMRACCWNPRFLLGLFFRVPRPVLFCLLLSNPPTFKSIYQPSLCVRFFFEGYPVMFFLQMSGQACYGLCIFFNLVQSFVHRLSCMWTSDSRAIVCVPCVQSSLGVLMFRHEVFFLYCRPHCFILWMVCLRQVFHQVLALRYSSMKCSVFLVITFLVTAAGNHLELSCLLPPLPIPAPHTCSPFWSMCSQSRSREGRIGWGVINEWTALAW